MTSHSLVQIIKALLWEVFNSVIFFYFFKVPPHHAILHGAGADKKKASYLWLNLIKEIIL